MKTGDEKYFLQPQLQTGEMKIAVLVRQTICGTHGGSGLGFMAQKQPVAIVIVTKSSHHIIRIDEGASPLIDDAGIRADINGFVEDGPTL